MIKKINLKKQRKKNTLVNLCRHVDLATINTWLGQLHKKKSEKKTRKLILKNLNIKGWNEKILGYLISQHGSYTRLCLITKILVIYFLYNQMIVCANKRYREITNKSKLNQKHETQL